MGTVLPVVACCAASWLLPTRGSQCHPCVSHDSPSCLQILPDVLRAGMGVQDHPQLKTTTLNSLILFMGNKVLRKLQHCPSSLNFFTFGAGRNCVSFPICTRPWERMEKDLFQWEFESHKGNNSI